MYCPNCGKEVFENSNFCCHCGKSIRTENKKSILLLPTNYIVFICLSLATILSVVLIPYFFFELNGHEYTMKAFIENEWPRQVKVARDLEIFCDIFLLATVLCSISGVVFAFKQLAKPCLISAILITISSFLGFGILFNTLAPIENSGGTPIGFMVNLIISIAMIVISTKMRKQEKPRKIKSPLLR